MLTHILCTLVTLKISILDIFLSKKCDFWTFAKVHHLAGSSKCVYFWTPVIVRISNIYTLGTSRWLVKFKKLRVLGWWVSRHKFFVHEWLCQLEHYVMTCTIKTQYFSTHHGTENCFQRIFIANHCYCNAGTFVVIVNAIFFFFPLILYLPCRLYAQARHTRTSLINLGGLAGRKHYLVQDVTQRKSLGPSREDLHTLREK